MLRRIIPALLLLAAPASAETWRANYQITVAGITMMEADVTFTLDQPGAPYSIESRLRGRGVAAMLVRGEQVARSEGILQATAVQPRRYESQGNWRGTPRRTVLRFSPDGAPSVVTLEPAQDQERGPVSEQERRGAIDTLSAIVQLTQEVRRTARCDIQARTFDGRRLIQFGVTTDPVVHVADRGLLRCLVESRPLAGLPTDRPIEEARRPTNSVAVFGVPQPGAPAIPMRIEIASRWWGTIQANFVGISLVQ